MVPEDQAESASGASRAAAGPRVPRSRLLERLTAIALLVGVTTTASYGAGMPNALRVVRPELGGWLDAHQFYLMEGAATTFGLLVGIRLGRWLAGDAASAPQTIAIALTITLVMLAPLVHLCAAVARIGWNGSGASLESWLVGREGYAAGENFARMAVAVIYFLKTAAYATLGGVALIAIVIAGSAASSIGAADHSSAGS
jgi:hypothetical protein